MPKTSSFSRFDRTPTCDGQTDTGPWLVPLMHSIPRLKRIGIQTGGRQECGRQDPNAGDSRVAVLSAEVG